jgi:acyl-CoA synthetase
MVDAVAADLDEAGLKRGERVSVWLPNRVETVAILLACSRQGYVCNPSLHQNYTVGEITELLSRIGAAAFFTEPGHGADARIADVFAAAAILPSLRRIYALGAGPSSAAPFPRAASASSLPPADNDPDKIVYLAFTSGTTGTPKGVMHSDNTLLANGRAMVADWLTTAPSCDLGDEPPHQHRRDRADDGGGLELVVNAPPLGKTLSTGPSRPALLMSGCADPYDGHPGGAPPAARPAGLGQGLLHGRLADPRGQRRPSRSRRPAAKRLWHDREWLAPIYLAER